MRSTELRRLVGNGVLLDALLLKGCLVTIDAMGCQKAIATQIVRQHCDY